MVENSKKEEGGCLVLILIVALIVGSMFIISHYIDISKHDDQIKFTKTLNDVTSYISKPIPDSIIKSNNFIPIGGNGTWRKYEFHIGAEGYIYLYVDVNTNVVMRIVRKEFQEK